MGYKSVRVSVRGLFVKSLIYRFYVTLVELALAYILKILINIDVIIWVLLINIVKLFAYFLYDLGWFTFIRKPGVLKKVKRWLG